ncbi:ABC transporter ATP-binding protein [Streptomyces cyaneofuscatus]|uniref:ABC transporter ATP-binding protein n=1 Tax=Streptomyces cyaneofuscatus TaxID=66883 RepID=UPI0033D98D67
MTTDHQLTAEDLTLSYGDRTVVSSLDLAVPPGAITVIVGANACGKSTLLRSMSRLLAPPARAASCWTARRCTASPPRNWPVRSACCRSHRWRPRGITVSDLVGRGRHPHQSMFSRWNEKDDAAVASALEATATEPLADRAVDELSGGQRQRVWIAMALAQQTDLLLLDEPTTFLDASHQIEVLDLLTDLNRSRGTTIVMVLHDLDLAARYADHLIALADGTLHAAGSPAEVLTEATVRAVFGLESRVIEDPVSGRPLMLPIGRHHVRERPGAQEPSSAEPYQSEEPVTPGSARK